MVSKEERRKLVFDYSNTYILTFILLFFLIGFSLYGLDKEALAQIVNDPLGDFLNSLPDPSVSPPSKSPLDEFLDPGGPKSYQPKLDNTFNKFLGSLQPNGDTTNNYQKDELSSSKNSPYPTKIKHYNPNRACKGSDKDGFEDLQKTTWSDPKILQTLNARGYKMQYIDENGGPVKYDEYTVIIERMPPGVTPELVLAAIADNPNKAANNPDFDEINVFYREGYGSPPGIGTVYHIDMKLPDNGSVIIVDTSPTSFTVHTIDTGITGPTGSHPESGVRQFGFERNPDGSVTFYTRGVSQGVIKIFDGYGKSLQSKGWNAFMKGLYERLTGSKISSSILGPPGFGGQICQESPMSESTKLGGKYNIIANLQKKGYCVIVIPPGAGNVGSNYSFPPTGCAKMAWYNDDTVPHTATSGTPNSNDAGEIFDTSVIQPGTAGTADLVNGGGPYHCTLHPFMISR